MLCLPKPCTAHTCCSCGSICALHSALTDLLLMPAWHMPGQLQPTLPSPSHSGLAPDVGTACTHAALSCPASCRMSATSGPYTLTLHGCSRSARLLPMLQHLRKHVALERLLVLDDQLGVRALEHRRARRARVLHRARRLLRQPVQVGSVAPAHEGPSISTDVKDRLTGNNGPMCSRAASLIVQRSVNLGAGLEDLKSIELLACSPKHA